ncbi:MAG: 6,7-dimethyl-8-ribityllumazine synthase, partial [Pseudomonadota bacterium]
MAGAGGALSRPEFAAPPHLLLVCAPFYRAIADNLLAGARAEIEAAGGTHETVEVPGALEVPT